MKQLMAAASLSMVVGAMQTTLAGDAPGAGVEQSPGTEQACGPPLSTENFSPEQRAKLRDATRAVALKFFKSTPDQQDKLLKANAYIWSVGIGEIDRARYAELHKPKPGEVDHGKPLSRKQTFNYVTVEGERAAVDMENYAVFKDFTYDQKYHNLVIVRDGKICALKIYADVGLAKQLIPGIDQYTKHQ